MGLKINATFMKSRKKKNKKNIELQHLNWNSILEPNVVTNLGRISGQNLHFRFIKKGQKFGCHISIS